MKICLVLISLMLLNSAFSEKFCGANYDSIPLKYFQAFSNANSDENNLSLGNNNQPNGLAYDFKVGYADSFKVIFNLSIDGIQKGENSVIDGFAISLTNDKRTSFNSSGGNMGTFGGDTKNGIVFKLDLFQNTGSVGDISSKSLAIVDCITSTCSVVMNSSASQVDLASVSYIIYVNKVEIYN